MCMLDLVIYHDCLTPLPPFLHSLASVLRLLLVTSYTAHFACRIKACAIAEYTYCSHVVLFYFVLVYILSSQLLYIDLR